APGVLRGRRWRGSSRGAPSPARRSGQHPADAMIGVLMTFLAALLLGGSEGSSPDPVDPLAELRGLYYAAVQEEHAIDKALAEVERRRDGFGKKVPTRLAATVTAYEGAVVTLKAKHGFWPTARLRHLNDGLAILDAVIAEDPA